MAISISQIGPAPVFEQFGNIKAWIGQIQFDSSYPTGGESIPATMWQAFGMLGVLGIHVIGIPDATSGGVVVAWNYATLKLMAFRSGGFTPAGTIGGNVTVVGGGIGEATGINPDSNAGVLSKAAATNRTIPLATYLGAAPTFTGTAVAAAALVEVANTTDLSAVTVRCFILGR